MRRSVELCTGGGPSQLSSTALWLFTSTVWLVPELHADQPDQTDGLWLLQVTTAEWRSSWAGLEVLRRSAGRSPPAGWDPWTWSCLRPESSVSVRQPPSINNRTTALLFKDDMQRFLLPNWLKVVSGCLLHYKPVCVTNFDKLRRKMLKKYKLIGLLGIVILWLFPLCATSCHDTLVSFALLCVWD